MGRWTLHASLMDVRHLVLVILLTIINLFLLLPSELLSLLKQIFLIQLAHNSVVLFLIIVSCFFEAYNFLSSPVVKMTFEDTV